MPSILLINENKIVSRLLQLSSEKNGYNLEEISALENSSGDSYDVIFIDGDKYNTTLMGELESKLNYENLGYISTKQETVPEGFDLVIEKPFLPTDFVDMIQEKVIIKSDVTPKNDEIEGLDIDDEADVLLEEDSLDLDDIDAGVEELLVSDEFEDDISLKSMDELDELEDLDEMDDVDLSLDPALMMTTGVAASMAVEDNSNEELSDMVNEIDLMEDDDFDLIGDELEALTDDEVSINDKDENIDTLAVAGAGIAAVGAVASTVFADDKPKIEDVVEEISTLNDLDSLNEADLQEALGEEVISDEIISQEITGGSSDETLVESNDVEQWIRDAVKKAITPQMIKRH